MVAGRAVELTFGSQRVIVYVGTEEQTAMDPNIPVGIFIGLTIWFLVRYLAGGIYTSIRTSVR